MPTTAMMIEALVAMRHAPDGAPAEYFWQLVERFRADLVNQAFGILGRQEDAEDAAQMALAKAFRMLHTLDDPQRLGVWMRMINRRTALNLLRERRRNRVRNQPAGVPEQPARETTPTGRDAEAVGRATRIEDVARAVDLLPPGYREVVVLRYWEHLKTEEIAARLGIPSGTVKSRMARADRILVEHLRRFWGEE